MLNSIMFCTVGISTGKNITVHFRPNHDRISVIFIKVKIRIHCSMVIQGNEVIVFFCVRLTICHALVKYLNFFAVKSSN